MSERPLASKRIRKNFSKIKKIVDIPDLIGVQRESFQRFLQADVSPENRKDIGLQAVFKSVFPIKDFTAVRPSNSSPIASARSNTANRSASTAA
jgi:DNA-directed RNA polymerase subunit beta